MSKSALGRGLGTLLPSRTEDAPVSDSHARVTPGVATLISGSRAANTADLEKSHSRSKPEIVGGARWTRLRWMLLAADGLLCGMSATILLRSSPAVRPEEAALCVAAMLLGAWLGCSAITIDRNPPL